VASLEPDADTTDAIASVFLPLPEYQRVLDDRVVLVLGERGVGKSAPFHFLQSAARQSLEQPGYPPHEWIVGFSETGSEHPSPMVLQELVASAEDAEIAARGFWLGHLAGRIYEGLKEAVIPPPLLDRWRAEPTNPRSWLTAVTDPTPVLLWLDQVERQLLLEQRTLVVTFDHLDKIGCISGSAGPDRRWRCHGSLPAVEGWTHADFPGASLDGTGRHVSGRLLEPGWRRS
jgi:hypothetical protein